MKKIFTLIAMCMMAIASQAAITIHVQAEKAPHLWAWVGSTNVFSEQWPGPQMTEKKTVQGTEFWYYTFDETITTVNILFNDGGADGPVKQTKDINGITTDRYFIYDGAQTATDVTTQYGGEVPDAKVESLFLKGNQQDEMWTGEIEFQVVEAGKSFKLVVDASDFAPAENLWKFKIRPNNQEWVGYSMVYDLEQEEPDGKNWLEQAINDDNFQIDLESTDLNGKVFTFSATWAGGTDAAQGWTLTVENGTADGIKDLRLANDNKQCYNLAGQSVKANYRGIVVMNGKKMMVK